MQREAGGNGDTLALSAICYELAGQNSTVYYLLVL
jgi:hypothetical protein